MLSSDSVTLKYVLYQDPQSTEPIQLNQKWLSTVDFLTNYVETSPCTIAEGPDKCKGKSCKYKSHSLIPKNPMCWSPVEITGLRLDVNVKAITLLVFDFDHLDEVTANKVKETLLPYEHVWHTTHNNRKNDICFRTVIALSRSVNANEWHRFLKSAVEYLNISVTDKENKTQPDSTCKNRSRFYYRPSHPKDAPFYAEHVQGNFLNVDEVLAKAEPDINNTSRIGNSNKFSEVTDWDLNGDAVQNAIDLVARYFPPNRRNELCLALGGMLRTHGATLEDAHYIVHEICAQGGSEDPEARVKTVEHTYSLSEDACMTGLTTVAQIIGEALGNLEEGRAVAKEFGNFLTEARNEAYLRGFESNSTKDITETHTINLFSLKEAISKLAIRKGNSLDRNDKILAILLRRALKGEALVCENDVETVLEGEEKSIEADRAIAKVLGSVAYIVPSQTSWEAITELFRATLILTPSSNGESWATAGKRIYERALQSKKISDLEHQKKEAEYKELVRISAIERSGSGGNGGNKPPRKENWEDDLTKKADGSLAQTYHNVSLFLKNHDDFYGHIKWNEISKKVEIHGGPLAFCKDQPLDLLVASIQDHLAATQGLTIQHRDLARRVISVAMDNKYDPLKDYLNSLKWDGKSRITKWLRTYCGAIETEENKKFLDLISRKWPIALVARGLEPGCKVDNVLVLESPGGAGKSTAFEIIGGEWFCDTGALNLGDKDSRMLAGRYWICELAEIVSFKRTGHDLLKSFWSSRIDKFRVPYGSDIQEFPRRCVFVGTTNDDHYLNDETGNRKYWTVTVQYTPGGLEALRRDRDQLLAEAVAAYRSGEKWWFEYEEISITEEEAEKRLVETPIGMKIKEWWFGMAKSERPKVMTTLEVWERAFDAPAVQAKDGDLIKIGRELKKLKFKKDRDKSGSKRVWRYYATEELLNAEKEVSPKRTLFSVPAVGKDV